MMIFVAVGSILSGHLIKRYDRIKVINSSILANFILHLLMGMVQNLKFFVLMRILIGFSTGVFIPLITNLLCEYCPIHRRSFVFNSTWSGYNLGCLFFAFSQLHLMPDLEVEKIPQTLIFTSILPLGVYIILKLYLKDSPRSLILQCKEAEAFEILKVLNKSELKESEKKTIIEEVMQGVNKELGGHFADIFKPKYRKMTCILNTLTNLSFLKSIS
jgi:MFS family permease